MKFKKKPVVVEASRWFKNGDHPHDNSHLLKHDGKEFLSEGEVVRRWVRPDIPSDTKCGRCGETMSKHGWVDTLEGGHTVCPGDWIITGVEGEHYPCKPDIFKKTYEEVEEDA